MNDGEFINYLTTCSSVSIVNFEWVNAGWVITLIRIKTSKK